MWKGKEKGRERENIKSVEKGNNVVKLFRVFGERVEIGKVNVYLDDDEDIVGYSLSDEDITRIEEGENNVY